MRIAEIHVYQKDLPVVNGPYTMSTMTIHAMDSTIIKMVSDTGLVGWGEVCPLGAVYQPQHPEGARAAIAAIAPTLIGQSALSPLKFQRSMNDHLNGHNYAKAGLEIAFMDLLAKYHGIRVCDLLGGAAQELVPAYYAIGIGSPEQTAETAREKVGQGYRRLQLKIGGRDIGTDIAVIRKTWEAVGPEIRLIADPNRGLTAADAKKLCIGCQDIPFMLEQPVKTMEEILSIRSQISHPIIIDENLESLNEVIRAISLSASDSFSLKITRMGGLGVTATIRDICAARSIPHTIEDSWGGDVISSAIIHMGATVEPRMLEGIWTATNYIEEHYDPENGPTMQDGYFKIPSGLGLGISPDEARIGQLEASYV